MPSLDDLTKQIPEVEWTELRWSAYLAYFRKARQEGQTPLSYVKWLDLWWYRGIE